MTDANDKHGFGPYALAYDFIGGYADLSPSEKLVYYQVMRFHPEKPCYLSNEAIGKKTGFTARQVRRIIYDMTIGRKKRKERGLPIRPAYIRCEYRHETVKGKTTTVRYLIPLVYPGAAPPQRTRTAKPAKTPDNGDPKPMGDALNASRMIPQPSAEPPKPKETVQQQIDRMIKTPRITAATDPPTITPAETAEKEFAPMRELNEVLVSTDQKPDKEARAAKRAEIEAEIQANDEVLRQTLREGQTRLQ